MLVKSPVALKPPTIIRLIGYVSKKGHGIKITQQNSDGATRKLRIFSNGQTSYVNISKKNDLAETIRLYQESYGFFKEILKKFSKSGNLRENESKNILDSYQSYRSKNRSHVTWWRPSGKPVSQLSEETIEFLKIISKAHKRASKACFKFSW